MNGREFTVFGKVRRLEMENEFGLLNLIGNTPVIKLNSLFPKENYGFDIYAKLESFNPGGSAKDRSAYSILFHAREDGRINDDTVIIESSSGNLGIALAQICKLWKQRLICVVDPKITPQNKKLLKAYGAELDCVTEPDEVTGEFLQSRLNRVKELLQEIPNSYWPNQYSNIYNPLGHRSAAKELFESLGSNIDYIFVAVGTCGTIRGYSDYIKDKKLKTKVIAVDAVGSVIFGGKRGRRLIPGHGAAVVPDLFYEEMAYECIHVTDMDCVTGCRRLLNTEAVFAGGSTGAIVSAIEKYSSQIPKGSKCAFIVHDRGERYLNNVYCDEWVNEKLCHARTEELVLH